MSDEDIRTITRSFGAFETVDARELDKPAEVKSNRSRQSANPKTEAAKTFSSKLFASHEFGYRRINIERPLRVSYQFSNERIATLRFAAKPLNAAMQWIYAEYGKGWTDDSYGALSDDETKIRTHLKAHFSELKEKQIKDLLDAGLWLDQRQLLISARALQQSIDTAQQDDFNGYEAQLKTACKSANVTLDVKQKKQLSDAVSWKNPAAECVIKKIHKGRANPIYGLFEVSGRVVSLNCTNLIRNGCNSLKY